MTIKSCLHTFVIAAYGNSPHIEECICSLRKQTIKSKIQIATSTPSPFIEQISVKYDIPLIVNSHSKGIASDWSFAYKNCSTKYITIAHQDDIYLPIYTELCLSAADFCEDSLIIFTNYSELRKKRAVFSRINFLVKELLLAPFLFKKNISLSFIKKIILSFGSPICCPTVMFNKENIGVLEFSNEFSVSLDWYAWLKLVKKNGSFVYVKEKTLLHRIHEKSASSLAISSLVRKKEDLIIFTTIWPGFLAKMFANLYYLSSKTTMVGNLR